MTTTTHIIFKAAIAIIAAATFTACSSDSPKASTGTRISSVSEQMGGTSEWTLTYSADGTLRNVAKAATEGTTSMTETLDSAAIVAEYQSTGTAGTAGNAIYRMTIDSVAGNAITRAHVRVMSRLTGIEISTIDYQMTYNAARQLTTLSQTSHTSGSKADPTTVVTTFHYSSAGRLDSCTSTDHHITLHASYNPSVYVASGLAPCLPMRLALDAHLLGAFYAGRLGQQSTAMPVSLTITSCQGISSPATVEITYDLNDDRQVWREHHNTTRMASGQQVTESTVTTFGYGQ